MFGNGLVERALTCRPKGTTILLSHTSWQAEAAARQGVALMLCGLLMVVRYGLSAIWFAPDTHCLKVATRWAV